MKENLKLLSIFFFGLLLFVFSLGLLIQSVYTPVRLFFTGETKPMIVFDKQSDIHFGRNGPIVTGKYIITRNNPRKFYVSPEKLYYKINLGDTVNVFYSKKLDEGIITTKNNPSLMTCLTVYKGTLSLIFSLLGVFIILKIIKRSWELNLKELKVRLNEIKEEIIIKEPKLANTYSTRYYLLIIQKLIPDLIILSFIYFLLIQSIYVITLTESLDKILVGIILSIVLFVINLFPFITLRLRKKLTNNNVVKNSLSILKITTGIYGIFKTILFINSSKFTNISNAKEIGINYLKFIFDL